MLLRFFFGLGLGRDRIRSSLALRAGKTLTLRMKLEYDDECGGLARLETLGGYGTRRLVVPWNRFDRQIMKKCSQY